MNEDYDGVPLVDNAGDEVGKIERTYIDDSGNVRFVEVKMGTLLPKHRLVPADRAERDGDVVRVPFTRDTIEESPAVKAGDTLEGETLGEVGDYYANDIGTVAEAESPAAIPVAASDSSEVANTDTVDEQTTQVRSSTPIEIEETPADFGKVRDLGDVIEIPIVEEVLVKRKVIREVLRVRKSQLTEMGTAAADLRKETVDVVSSSPDLVSDASATREDESDA